jgi:hypothetical protein
MVVNFRAREISRGARKLTRTPMLNLKKKSTFNRELFLIIFRIIYIIYLFSQRATPFKIIIIIYISIMF